MRICFQGIGQLHIVGKGCTEDILAERGSRVEIGNACAFRRAPDIVAAALIQRLLYLRAIYVIGQVLFVFETIVKYLPIFGYQRDAQTFGHLGIQVVLRDDGVDGVFFQDVVQAVVIVLQLHMQQIYFIGLFTLILVDDKRAGEYQKEGDDRKEEFAAEREKTFFYAYYHMCLNTVSVGFADDGSITLLRNNIHIPAGLRSACHNSLSSYAGG